MPFGVENESPTYQTTIIKTFHEYIDVFMKVFLDYFIVFNDMLIHLENLKCFFKYRKFGISLNLNKCAFTVFSRTSLGFIVSKKARSWILRKLKL
jgi:hypothetical protein